MSRPSTLERITSTTRQAVYLVLIAALAALLAILVATGLAQQPAAHLTRISQPLTLTAVETIVTAADLAPALSTTARPGEGVIRIVTRVCGSAAGWQAVAAANGITPYSRPPYLVRLGQHLSVSCSASGRASSTTAQPAAPPSSAGWVAPVRACIVSGFGMRWGRMHNGVDLSAGYGVPVLAAAGGTVTRGWQAGGAGNYITIAHGGGVFTHYMHLSSFAVATGQRVGAGQMIGRVGQTGNASGPHLHFEVRPYGSAWGSAANPVPFMSARGVRLGC